MTTTNTEKKPRLSGYDRILNSVLNLDLKDRVKLAAAIKNANEKEVAEKEAEAKSAAALLNGQ